MQISRRSLRKGLIAVGCLVGSVSYPEAAVAAGLIGVGSGLHLWSKGCLEQNRRLTKAGPYRFSRNPFYLANLMIDFGLCCVIGVPWVAAVFASLWGISYHQTIRGEEDRLEALFPNEYPAYRAAVPRLIPWRRPLPQALVSGRFSFSNPSLARGAEYARLLGVAIAPCVIAAAEIVRRDRLGLFDGGHMTQLAFVLLPLALWIVKLALAETLRRPQTVLVPWLKTSNARWLLAIALTVGALIAAAQELWLGLLPGLWVSLLILDVMGDRRSQRLASRNCVGWSYSSAIAAGSLATLAFVTALRH